MQIGTDLQHYYERLHLNRNIVYLYLNRILIQVGAGMLTIFTAVFFYEQFNNSFRAVALLFAFAFGSFAVFTPLSAMFIERLGLKRMLIISIFFLPLTILSLVWWDTNPTLSLCAYLLFGLIYRLLYWTPYHIDMAKFTKAEDRGKQLSLLSNISEVVLSTTPFIAGLIIAAYGFNTIFILVSLFMGLSIIPLFFIDNTCERYKFGYFETYQKLFSKKNRSLMLAYAGDGIQSGVRIIIWPIFIFVLLEGNYAAIGFVTMVTILLLIVLRFVIGGLADTWNRKRLLVLGVFLSTTGWIAKAFVDTGLQIFVADTYHRMGRAVNRLSADILMYDQAVDNGHYIDEYTVLRELAVNLGRTGMLLVAVWVSTVFGLPATFILAALATLLMMSLHKAVQLQ